MCVCWCLFLDDGPGQSSTEMMRIKFLFCSAHKKGVFHSHERVRCPALPHPPTPVCRRAHEANPFSCCQRILISPLSIDRRPCEASAFGCGFYFLAVKACRLPHACVCLCVSVVHPASSAACPPPPASTQRLRASSIIIYRTPRRVSDRTALCTPHPPPTARHSTCLSATRSPTLE